MAKNKFVVCFKGVRGSYPVSDRNFINYGGNTACVYVSVNGYRIILDAGSGIANAGKQIQKEIIAAQDKNPLNLIILLSHFHYDHIQGLPFLSQLHSPNATINLFAEEKNDEDLKKNISDLLFGKTFPLSVDEIKSNIKMHAINDKNNDFAIVLKDKANNNEPIITKASMLEELGVTEKDVVITTLFSKTHPSSFNKKFTYYTKRIFSFFHFS